MCVLMKSGECIRVTRNTSRQMAMLIVAICATQVHMVLFLSDEDDDDHDDQCMDGCVWIYTSFSLCHRVITNCTI